jgi:alkanesulfonate monooxygenase SsuD/methylene tetrahydromethanopterin reductase-like flavin-dependent oxidoreductase (luciferase family)
MFGLGQREHDERYEVADEWAQVLKQLWTVEGEADFHGAGSTSPAASRSRSPSRSPTRS